MNGGGKFLASAAVLMTGACGGEQGKLQIRPSPAPLSATAQPVPFRIAEATSQLALGNVALAVESFRKALREEPNSVPAMAGLAACYDQMSRFDLSRRYYESALAIAPANTSLLNAFARSLETQGRTEEAAAVRREVNMRVAAADPGSMPAPQPPARQQRVALAPAPVPGPSVTVALPQARPIIVTAKTPAAPTPRSVAVAIVERPVAPPPQPIVRAEVAQPKASVEVAAAAQPKPPPPKRVEVAVVERPIAPLPKSVAIAPVEQPKAPSQPRAAAPTGSSVTVSLPPPRPVAVVVAKRPIAPPPAAEPVAITTATAPPPAAAPVIVSRMALAEPLRTPKPAVRLERMSLAEVTLVTNGQPQWRSRLVSKTAQSATIRYVPLRSAQARPVQIRLLNAARHQGLAARTRNLLADRGWRKLAIGDANQVRQTSLILYPPSRRGTAERLSAQFGIPIAKRESGKELVMLIGRDLAKRTAPRAGG